MAQLNRAVMTAVFFLPLMLIALYEAVFRARKNGWMKTWFRDLSDDDDSPESRDPDTSGGGDGAGGELQIARVKFDDLVRVFPDAAMSEGSAIVKEIREVRSLLQDVLRRLDEGQRVAANGAAQAIEPAEGKKKKKKGSKKGSSSSSSSSSSD